ncbi:16403_t:CDS:1, partial [Racocetra fulgida]
MKENHLIQIIRLYLKERETRTLTTKKDSRLKHAKAPPYLIYRKLKEQFIPKTAYSKKEFN